MRPFPVAIRVSKVPVARRVESNPVGVIAARVLKIEPLHILLVLFLFSFLYSVILSGQISSQFHAISLLPSGSNRCLSLDTPRAYYQKAESSRSVNNRLGLGRR